MLGRCVVSEGRLFRNIFPSHSGRKNVLRQRDCEDLRVQKAAHEVQSSRPMQVGLGGIAGVTRGLHKSFPTEDQDASMRAWTARAQQASWASERQLRRENP